MNDTLIGRIVTVGRMRGKLRNKLFHGTILVPLTIKKMIFLRYRFGTVTVPFWYQQMPLNTFHGTILIP